MPLRVVSLSFIDWKRKYKHGAIGLRERAAKCTLAIGVRFAFELLDIFIGQYAAIFLPHYEQGCFEKTGDGVMEYTVFFSSAS